MPRKVFFSFHYDDVARANVVRKSDAITRRYREGFRFYDHSLWEKAKKDGALAIKRMINGALHGSSVTCVLIGRETWERTWVRYEILQSMARGNGILGVQIHDVGFGRRSPLEELLAPQRELSGLFAVGAHQSQSQPRGLLSAALLGSDAFEQPTSPPGPNPLRYLGYTIDRFQGTVTFHEFGWDNQWRQSEHVDPVQLSDLPWLFYQKDADNLANLFPVYAWKNEHGFQKFPAWVEAAARQVGR